MEAVPSAVEPRVQPARSLRPPPGRRILLDGRGTTFVRDVPGPEGAPTLLLLHGWTASAGLNWFQAFGPLAEHFRVIAPDLRGHGRGIKSWAPFRLIDCADDVAALLEELGTGPVIAVGYSMGGAVAQLLWRRHRRRVAGMVLCATSHELVAGQRERFLFTTWMSALAGTTRLGELIARNLPASLAGALAPTLPASRPGSLVRWAANEMGRHNWRMVLEAGISIGRFDASAWIGNVNVPTVVLVTARDRALGALPQMRTALAIPGATIHTLEDGHGACAQPGFGPALLAACQEVAGRAEQRRDAQRSRRLVVV